MRSALLPKHLRLSNSAHVLVSNRKIKFRMLTPIKLKTETKCGIGHESSLLIFHHRTKISHSYNSFGQRTCLCSRTLSKWPHEGAGLALDAKMGKLWGKGTKNAYIVGDLVHAHVEDVEFGHAARRGRTRRQRAVACPIIVRPAAPAALRRVRTRRRSRQPAVHCVHRHVVFDSRVSADPFYALSRWSHMFCHQCTWGLVCARWTTEGYSNWVQCSLFFWPSN